MAQPGGAAQRSKKKGGGLVWLLAGIVIGVLGTVLLPDLAAPYLPEALRSSDEQVAGVVEAKSTEVDRLLLTVGSESGATLVTFRKDVAEIDLLVSVGDSVWLAIEEYAPFIDDARISRVMKPRDWRAGPARTSDTAAAADTAAAGIDTAPVADTAQSTDTTGAGTPGGGLDTQDAMSTDTRGAGAADTAPPDPSP